MNKDNSKKVFKFIKIYFRYIYIPILILIALNFVIKARYIHLRENVEIGIIKYIETDKNNEDDSNILAIYDKEIKNENEYKKYLDSKEKVYINKGIEKTDFNKDDIYYSEYIKSFIVLSSLIFLIYTICIIYFYIENKKILKHLADISEILEAYPDKTKLENIIQYSEGEIYKGKSDINKLVQKYVKTLSEEESSRISIEDFISDISHQIRIPISNISVQIYSIKNELNKNLEIELNKSKEDQNDNNIKLINSYIKKTKSIEEDIKKISFLIEELLKMARLDAKSIQFKKGKIYFNDFIKKIIEKFRYTLELGNIEVVLEENEDAYFMGDYNWCMEAVSNILKNAIEISKENKKIYIFFKDLGLYSRIYIKDEGEGLTKEEIKNIFKRFYKGKNSKETSIGIGLNISKKIMEAQDGYINIKSKKGLGSEFILGFLK